jgi:nucleotide-binding universal stress UspA family protein
MTGSTRAIRTIVVGIDGSANASAALAWAIDLARAVEAEVVAVHAVGLREAGQGHPVEQRAEFETRWCAPLDAAGLKDRRLLVDGDPVSVLLRTAEETGADVIVVGTRGVGDRQELLLGSTSSQVTRRSVVPVVVIPPGQ